MPFDRRSKKPYGVACKHRCLATIRRKDGLHKQRSRPNGNRHMKSFTSLGCVPAHMVHAFSPKRLLARDWGSSMREYSPRKKKVVRFL